MDIVSPRVLLGALALGVLAGCGARGDLGQLAGDEAAGAPSGPPAGTSPRPPPPGPPPEPLPPPGTTPSCTDAEDPIYLLSSGRTLHRYCPETGGLEEAGEIQCDGMEVQSPNTMAIGYDGWLWVNLMGSDSAGGDLEGQVRRVEREFLGCGEWFPLPDTAWSVAMTSRRGVPGGMPGELGRLWVAGMQTTNGEPSPLGLATLDLQTGALDPVAPIGAPMTGVPLDLRSTDDGRLFGLFRTSPMQLGEIDATTGAVTGLTEVPWFDQPPAWALAYRQGAFYLFMTPPGGSSHVSRYWPEDGTFELDLVGAMPLVVVGADTLPWDLGGGEGSGGP